uniref:Uncharacterized protein n=1 Tax=Cavia porcellus TaxID=10141 RepID=H0W2M3_CAVPO
SQKRDIGYFNNLKADSRNVTNGMTFSTKSIQATIIGDEGCDLLPVLDQLDPDALPDGGIRLRAFHLHFFQHDSLGVGGPSERVSFQGCAQVGLLVLLIVPLLVPPVTAELPGSTQPAALA